MNRFALLLALAGLVLSNTALAADPAFCKSMCDSEKRECRAGALEKLELEGAALDRMPEKNPMARGAQEQMLGQDARALESSGYQRRRMERVGACDDKYLRCTRSCAAPTASKGSKNTPLAADAR